MCLQIIAGPQRNTTIQAISRDEALDLIVKGTALLSREQAATSDGCDLDFFYLAMQELWDKEIADGIERLKAARRNPGMEDVELSVMLSRAFCRGLLAGQ